MPYADPAARRAYQRDWCRRKRLDALQGRSCEHCGTTTDLEFHHVDPSEKLTHRIWGWAPERLAKELLKCVVLCTDCHRAETAKQRRERAEERYPCGTPQSFWRGCRCTRCYAARAAYEKAKRDRVEELAA
jgi:5-methylcytosine-specific restriction endonuclease McrA